MQILLYVGSCVCNSSHGKCVMTAFAGSQAGTEWTDCSISDLNAGIAVGVDVCLHNMPTTIVGDPICGNMIREGDEICDCGTPEVVVILVHKMHCQ